MPPSPILRRTRYSPTSIPSGRSPGPAAPPRRRSIVGSCVPPSLSARFSAPPASRDHDTRERQQRGQAVRQVGAADGAATAAPPALAATRAAAAGSGGASGAGPATARAGAAAASAAAPDAATRARRTAVGRTVVDDDGARLDGVVLLADAERVAAVRGQVAVHAAGHRVQPGAVDRPAGGVVGRHHAAEADAVAGLALAADRSHPWEEALGVAIAHAAALAGRVAGAVDAVAVRIGAGRDRDARADRAGDVAAAALVAVDVAADAVAAGARAALRVADAGVALREDRRTGRLRAAVGDAAVRDHLAVTANGALGIGRAVRPAGRRAVHVVAAEASAVHHDGRRVGGAVARAVTVDRLGDQTDVGLAAGLAALRGRGRPQAAALTVALSAAVEVALAVRVGIGPRRRERAGARGVGAGPARARAGALTADAVDAVAVGTIAVERARGAVRPLAHHAGVLGSAIHAARAGGIREARPLEPAGSGRVAVARGADAGAGVDAADAVHTEARAALRGRGAPQPVRLAAHLAGAVGVAVRGRVAQRRRVVVLRAGRQVDARAELSG